MRPSTSTKTQARECAFKFLYQWTMGKTQDVDNVDGRESAWRDFQDTYSGPDDEHPDNDLNIETWNMAKTLAHGALEQRNGLEERISEALNNYKLGRVAPIERAILLLGAYELICGNEVPPKVVISEAIRLAKKFGPETSYSFINGVLDKMAREEHKL